MAHKARTKSEHHARATHILGAKAVHKHEANMHPGKTPTKLASGGHVKGPKSVNVIIHTGSQAEKQLAQQQGMQQGVRLGAQMGAQNAIRRTAPPPGGPPGGGAPPMGGHPPMPAPGGMPPGAGPMAGGGTVKVRAHTRRKGGRV